MRDVGKHLTLPVPALTLKLAVHFTTKRLFIVIIAYLSTHLYILVRLGHHVYKFMRMKFKSFALETISITLNQVKEGGAVRASAVWVTLVWTYQKEDRWMRTNKYAEATGDGRGFSDEKLKLSWNLTIDTWWLRLIMWLLVRKTNTPGEIIHIPVCV